MCMRVCIYIYIYVHIICVYIYIYTKEICVYIYIYSSLGSVPPATSSGEKAQVALTSGPGEARA